MSFKIEDINGIKVAKLEGKLDVSLSISIESDIEKLIESGILFLVFDLSSVEYLSSSGLRVFISVMRTLKDKDGKLVLACVPEIVKKIFKTVELDDLFEVYDTVEQATKACKK